MSTVYNDFNVTSKKITKQDQLCHSAGKNCMVDDAGIPFMTLIETPAALLPGKMPGKAVKGGGALSPMWRPAWSSWIDTVHRLFLFVYFNVYPLSCG